MEQHLAANKIVESSKDHVKSSRTGNILGVWGTAENRWQGKTSKRGGAIAWRVKV